MSSDPVAPQSSVAALIGRALRWRLPLVLVIAATMSAAGLWMLERQPDVYEAATVLSVAPRADSDNSSDLLKLSAQRYAVMLGSGDTTDEVSARTGVEGSRLDSGVEISVPTETANIRIEVRQDDAEQAARVANAFAAIGQDLGASDPSAAVNIASAAQVPREPAWPPRVSITILILLLAAGGALLVATVMERWDPRVRTRRELESAISAPVVGTLPRSAAVTGSLMEAMADSDLGAAVRTMRTRFLAQRAAGAFPRSVAVTSIGAGAGVSTVSALLAIALARSGVRAVVVDAASGHRLTAGQSDPGAPPQLAGVVADEGPLQLHTASYLDGRLIVLSVGSTEDDVDVLARAFPKLLGQAAEFADVVIIDCPTLRDDVAASAVIAHADAALLVVPPDSSTRVCHLTAGQFVDLEVPLLGAVVNHGPRRSTRRHRVRTPGLAGIGAQDD